MVKRAPQKSLRRRRSRLGVSLDEMAAQLGVGDASVLSRWERGFGGLPGGMGRDSYAAALDRIEREREAVA